MQRIGSKGAGQDGQGKVRADVDASPAAATDASALQTRSRVRRPPQRCDSRGTLELKIGGLQDELRQVRTEMERHEVASQAYETAGLQILELAQTAYSSYVAKNPHEQARLITTLVSNSTFDRGSLSPTYVTPFDVFAKGSETGDWLLGLDSPPFATSESEWRCDGGQADGDKTERSEGLAPRAGLEPATLRLTD
jgi:hypothetical protein